MSKVLKTKSYLKFTEFCNACKKYSYIGICDGSPGVGKTFSARCYTHWDMIEQIVPPYHLANPLPVEELDGCDSVFYTAPVTSSPARLEREIYELYSNLNWLINDVAPPKKATDTDKEVFSQIAIITRGNFRLLQRLFMQIEFIMQVNNYYVLDKDVVETAGKNLMIGKI